MTPSGILTGKYFTKLVFLSPCDLVPYKLLQNVTNIVIRRRHRCKPPAKRFYSKKILKFWKHQYINICDVPQINDLSKSETYKDTVQNNC